MARPVVRHLVIACAVTSALIGGGVAHASAVSTPAGKIPKGFLTYESKAARKQVEFGETTWTRTDRRQEPLLASPCAAKKPADTGRVAVRTITSAGDNDIGNNEQLVLYRSEALARGAMDGLRAAFARCRTMKDYSSYVYRAQAVRIGDEALRVIGQDTMRDGPGGGQRIVVTRRGSALILEEIHSVYDARRPVRFRKADFARQEKVARAMAEKVCALPGVCR